MRRVRLGVLAVWIPSALATAAAAASPADPPGFLVIAPDRGFLGNEETRDAFETFAAERSAALVFMTDERTNASLDAAVRSLEEAGAGRVVVLPFFLSRSDPGFARGHSLLSGPAAPGLSVEWALPFGESYLAVEALADRLRALPDPAGRCVVVVGPGAPEESVRVEIEADVRRLTAAAAEGLGFETVRTAVPASHEDLEPRLRASLEGGARPAIVPYHLGRKLDSMMSFTSAVRRAAPEGAVVADADLTPDPAVATWMSREANRHTPPQPEEVGVVVLAHGSDFHWNETMRQAVAPLSERYKVEMAFSMADPPVIERAVRRLEERGARHVVILRVFGLADSFRAGVERLIGLDIELDDPQPVDSGHGHGHGHGPAAPPPRIRSAAVITTTGGLDDHPLFAKALLERARALSHDPALETVILVAHGVGDDAGDARWIALLESLAEQVRVAGGDRFRAIRVATWREDWADKRKAAVARIRSLVAAASRDGGRAIVVPARTLGQGPEQRLLEGLVFEHGEGFAPHPLFARWAEGEVAAAVAAMRTASDEASEGRRAARQ